MVEPTLENKDAFGGMEIYRRGIDGAIDLSDNAIRKIEDGLNVSDKPKPVVHSKLFEQLDPEERPRQENPFGEFSSGTPRPTELAVDSAPVSSGVERNRTDVELEDMALQAFYDGRTDLTIRYFSEVSDRSAIQEQMETVLSQLADLRDYADALQIAELIVDPAEREKKITYIKQKQKKYAPTTTGDLVKADRDALDAHFASSKIDEGRRVNLKIVTGSEPVVKPTAYADLSSNPNPSLPDIAAEYSVVGEPAKDVPLPLEVKASTVPPEVPPANEAIAPIVPNEPKNIVKRESAEADFEALRVARDKYARAYTEWEYKIRNSTKMWEKTMFALGATKPAPERLTLRTTELEDMREEYIKACELCGKKTSNTYAENYERGTEEKLLLQEAMQNAREEREFSDEQNRKMADEMMPKTVGDKIKDSPAKVLRYLNNKWLAQSSGKKSLLALTLVSGSAVFAAPIMGVAGLRVARGVLGVAVGKTVGAGFGKYFENKNATNEELDLKEYAGSINEANFAEVEAKRLQAFENSLNARRRQNVIRIGAMALAGGAAAMASGSYSGSLMGEAPAKPSLENLGKMDVFEAKPSVKVVTPEDLGVGELNADLISPDLAQEVHSLKVDILSHYHDGEVPYAIKKNILDVPTEKLLEQFHLLDAEHNASAGSIEGGHILFENGKVVYEQGGITRDLFDPNIEIGQKAYSNIDFGAKQGIELEPEPIPAKDILTGEPLVPAENIKVPQQGIDTSTVEMGKVGETLLEQSFEGGKISVIHGTPGDPNRISMLFDGKEFAVGSINDGIPKIAVLPEFKGGWLVTTIYERAFSAMKGRINPDTLGIV